MMVIMIRIIAIQGAAAEEEEIVMVTNLVKSAKQI
jgi:hypothetical protein